MPKKLQDIALSDVPALFADGLSAQDISERLNAPIRTVYYWLARPEVQQAIKNELSFREATRRRMIGRHYGKMADFAADVVVGKEKIESPEQMRLLMAFLGVHDAAPDAGEIAPPPSPAALPAGSDTPMLPAGPLEVHFHVAGQGDGGGVRGARPTIIDVDEDGDPA